MPRDALANGWPHKLHTPLSLESQVGKHGILDLRQVLQRLHRWQATVSTATGEEEWRQGASFFCTDCFEPAAARAGQDLPWCIGRLFLKSLRTI